MHNNIKSYADRRLQNEVEHAIHLLRHGPGELWGWEGEAGRTRLKRRVNMLTSHISAGMKVLEIGCGIGYFTTELAKTGAGVTAIDISPDLLAEAKKNIKSENVIFKEENAYALSFAANSFDSIIGSSVLHHLDIEKAIAEFHRVLKVGGSVYFTEPNMVNPQLILQKNVPFLRRMAGESPDETALCRWKILKILSSAGFRRVSVQPFDFLHPKTPRALIGCVVWLGNVLEKIPLVSEVSGSLYIKGYK